jgi:hypothetical protein
MKRPRGADVEADPVLEKDIGNGGPWLPPIIPVTWEEEIGRTMVPGLPRSKKKTRTKKATKQIQAWWHIPVIPTMWKV